MCEYYIPKGKVGVTINDTLCDEKVSRNAMSDVGT